MTIGPTVGGGLKLVPEEEQDWLVLLEIAHDGDNDLASELAGLMDEDSMWDEIVVPELQTEFSTQRRLVLKAIIEARSSGDEEVVIEPGDAESWYGALNQARLALESEYRFGPRELNNPGKIESAKMRSAYFRNDFYCTVQSLLLKYVMSDGE